MNLPRNLSTPENRAFWKSVDKAAAEVQRIATGGPVKIKGKKQYYVEQKIKRRWVRINNLPLRSKKLARAYAKMFVKDGPQVRVVRCFLVFDTVCWEG